jgi:hypothetical protein
MIVYGTLLAPRDEQEAVDRFYWKTGQCCSGCDWWVHLNSVAGECRKSAPVAASERWSMMGFHGCSEPDEAGHVVTPREHYCGAFKDDFDWSSLSATYLSRIGANPDTPHQTPR